MGLVGRVLWEVFATGEAFRNFDGLPAIKAK